jgi:hypothetical protein
LKRTGTKKTKVRGQVRNPALGGQTEAEAPTKCGDKRLNPIYFLSPVSPIKADSVPAIGNPSFRLGAGFSLTTNPLQIKLKRKIY